MKAIIAASSLTLALLLPTMSSASELKPMQGGTFELGDQNASIYFIERGENYQVVTTIAPDAEMAGAPIRFVSLLQPGQIETISVGSYEQAAASTTLELVHDGDVLLVNQKTQTAELN